jgi:hypothetical protein
VTRLPTVWTEDYQAFSDRDLSDVDHVYVWAARTRWGSGPPLRGVFPSTREQRCWFHYADLWVMG